MAKDMGPLEFGLDLGERPVTIAGEAYVLRELDGKGRDRYLNNVGARLRVTREGKAAGVKDFNNLQASLVSQSLHKVVEGGDEPVPVATIQTWPSHVVSALFKAARELSHLGEDEEDKAVEGDEDTVGND